jgi:hypothetical protein
VTYCMALLLSPGSASRSPGRRESFRGPIYGGVDTVFDKSDTDLRFDNAVMNETKSSHGLVLARVELTGLTEFVSMAVGTRPQDLLGDRRPTRVAGDRIAGFYRTSDARGRHREAYSWGGLTAHSPLRALWLVLLSATLANMAGWTARRAAVSGEPEST